MAKKTANISVPDEIIMNNIYYIRNQKVMLDRDLSKLYGVETMRLNEAVKRNITRFPQDFMFQLSEIEAKNLISQNAISSWGGTRKLPHVFTEQGVAMLSSVLKSEKAIAVNIQIMRIFMRLRQMLIDNTELRLGFEELKKKTDNNTKKHRIGFSVSR